MPKATVKRAKARKPAAKKKKPAKPRSRASSAKKPAPKAAPPRGEGPSYWLVKSEPEAFSFDDLMARPDHTTFWDGVRNFAARGHMRAMKKGDPSFSIIPTPTPRRSSGSRRSRARRTRTV